MPSVLIIEEQVKIRKSLVNAFKREHCKMCTGIGWENAAACLEKDSYDLIIVDLEGNQQVGHDMLETVRRTNPNAEIVAIFNPQEYNKERIVSYGVYDYLLKPFLLKDIVNIGKKALEKKQLADKVRSLEQIRDMDKFALS